MSRTFSDELRYDAANVFVNANEFGESVTWRQRDGSESSVDVVIAARRQRAPTGDRPASHRDTDAIERIGVMVAQSTLQRRPEIGEAVTRSSDIDSDARPWVYSGECEHFDAASAIYIFERSRKQITTRG